MINPRECNHAIHYPSGKCMTCGEQHQPLPDYQPGDDEKFKEAMMKPDHTPDTREKLAICDLPKVLKGHWDTVGGREMAQCYAGKTRADLCHGEMSDLAVANAVYMADRYDLDLITWQTAAKERIRWLSVQLALSRARNGGQP